MTAACAVCQVADGCHCLPLFPAVQGCGCPVGEGHRCPPPWVDEWPEPVAANRECPTNEVESGAESGAPSLRQQTRGDDHSKRREK